MAKNLTLKDCDAERAEMLVAEIGKVRCWLTGWKQGRVLPGQMSVEGPPGEDALRQIQIILQGSVASSRRAIMTQHRATQRFLTAE